ncbi:flagellar basal-body MS-ring/collar protein FliF [Emcibacter nanhaiensis]|uniref:flagellar basal-body MS-ring/collar protein FliF n=1 Tax=Emcibacter nanhaiensis TaxID=1505037 RepID=UPI0015E2CA95|nr:flagellar basal-body MS-ring/collar protein FliF [Emcibacter nanhaiensis]
MNSLSVFFRTLGPARLAAMGTVAAIIIGFFIYLTMRLSTPTMGLLYSGLDLGDANNIVQQLESQAIPYQIAGDGGTILVPEDQVHRLRMMVAGQGLNSGGSVGYDIFDRQDSLGTTSFVQNINHLRALEGELARTIQSMEKVNSARVHLVMPERRLFSNESREATASIFIKTGSDRLSRTQVAAVQNLVAAAVPDLSPERISIVDQKGSLLARGNSEDAASVLASSLEEKKVSTESRLRRQIEELLEKTVGLGKVRAEVNAELDLNRITSNSEIYDPDGQVVLSSQTRESTSTDLENADEAEVSVANNLPDQDAANAGEPAIKNQSSGSTTEETVNYKVSKTIRTQIHEAGTIKRISVAVLVDGTYAEQGEGEPAIYQPRSPEELAQLENLVKSAIGYDEERGDNVSIVNMQFAEVDYGESLPEEGLFSFGKGDILWLIELGVLLIGFLAVTFFGLRPLIKYITAEGEGGPLRYVLEGGEQAQLPPGQAPEQAALAPPQPEGKVVQTGEGKSVVIPVDETGKKLTAREVAQKQGIESAIDIAAVEGKIEATAIKKVGELVEKYPEESTAVVRNWLYG